MDRTKEILAKWSLDVIEKDLKPHQVVNDFFDCLLSNGLVLVEKLGYEAIKSTIQEIRTTMSKEWIDDVLKND